MSFVIAAAGTGGHVFPGLAVAEALMAEGAKRDSILFVGGSRIEAKVYPDNGFPFLELELRGLKRSLSPANLSLPRVVLRARNRIVDAITERSARCLLGMGGYVTIPAAMAARKTGIALMVAEQNAGAGLANRIASRWAARTFSSFPRTHGLEDAEWVGNPVRSTLAGFDRNGLRDEALQAFGLERGIPTLGVFGGSLGAKPINEAVASMAAAWTGPRIQVLHLVGSSHVDDMSSKTPSAEVTWVRHGFVDRMDLFFAAVDLVVARAGGAVAEITATATPSILVPGDFGSGGHQSANAGYLERAGAARVVPQAVIERLGDEVRAVLLDSDELARMASAAGGLARPGAAKTIAQAMIEATT